MCSTRTAPSKPAATWRWSSSSRSPRRKSSAERELHAAGDMETGGLVDILSDMTRNDATRLLHAHHPSPPVHGFEARRRDPRQLGRLSAEVPQGHAGRVSPGSRRARGTRTGRTDASGRRVDDHGQDHRLSRNRPQRPALCAGRRPRAPLSRVHHPAVAGSDPRPGGALHGLRHPLLSHRLPGEQPDPRLERSRLSRRVAAGAEEPALDQQLPGIHRPRLPGAVRSLVHPQHHRGAGHHQDDRVRHRRPRLAGRLDQAAAAARKDRQVGGRRRLRPGGPGLRPAACPRRP